MRNITDTLTCKKRIEIPFNPDNLWLLPEFRVWLKFKYIHFLLKSWLDAPVNGSVCTKKIQEADSKEKYKTD